MRNINKNIKIVLFALFVIFFFTMFSTIETFAYTNKIDISKNQPVVIIEGEDISPQTLVSAMNYNNQTVTVKSIAVNVDGMTIGSGVTSTTKLNTNIFDLTTTSPKIYGEIILSFINPETNIQENTTLELCILKNNLPNVEVSHINIGLSELEEYKKVLSKLDDKSLYKYIQNQVVVKDVDNTATDIDIYTYNGGEFDIDQFVVGTTPICITVTDLNKTVSIQGYVTVYDDTENENKTNKTGNIRAITKEYFPFYLENIKLDSDNNYYAKRENGIYYFINKDNDFLIGENNNRFPVDACVSCIIQPTGSSDIYKVIPISKWIVDENCRELLVNCLTGDSSQYISSWTFGSDDVKVIQELMKDRYLDENFYHNYLTNGYCEQGSKYPNQTIREDINYTIDNGLIWYITNQTLYIKVDESANINETYAIPDFSPVSIKISELVDEDKIVDQTYGNPIYVFSRRNNYKTKTNAPWASYDFNEVILDDRITKIGDYAFYGCFNITKPIKIPNQCTVIGEAAFMNCINMTGSINTNHVYEIKPFAFANCYGLNGTLTLGENSLNIIGDGAFYDCNLTGGIIIPSSVSKVGKYAFANCDKFNGGLSIGNNVSEIGEYAFMGCSKLNGDLVLPESLKELNRFTFAFCNGLNGKLKLNEGLVQIGDYALYGCSNLTGNIKLPETLTTIGICAFKNCSNFNSTLTINKNLIKIDIKAFEGCVGITDIDNYNENASLEIETEAFYCNDQINIKIYKEGTILSNYNYTFDNRNKIA